MNHPLPKTTEQKQAEIRLQESATKILCSMLHNLDLPHVSAEGLFKMIENYPKMAVSMAKNVVKELQ